MATFTQAQGLRTPSVLSLGSLGSGTYLASSVIDLGAEIPLDVTLEVECVPSAATTGNKQLILFVKLSLDNSNFGSGPENLTATTNEADLHYVGTLPCNDSSMHRKFFSLQGLPAARYLKLVVKNDMGVAIASGNIYTAAITGVSA